jgi:hypothetical protein
MSAFPLHTLPKAQLRALLSDAAKKLQYVRDTVKDIPAEYIPYPRLREIAFLEQRIGEYRAEIARRLTPNTPTRVFYSYSRCDRSLLAELDDQFAGLKSEGLMITFWDRDIEPGRDWHSEINEELDDADIILFLVSPDFFASKYCSEVELPAAVDMHNCGLTLVIPIILRECEWQDTPLGRFQALPKDGMPMNSRADRAAAWSEMVQDIYIVLKQLRQASV